MDMDNDPYTWTIPQVVAAVAPHDPVLARSLTENEVDGETLLTACTYERLKTDLGIIPLGQRGKVMRKIEMLRKQSAGYAAYVFEVASGTVLPEEEEEEEEEVKEIRALGIPCMETPRAAIGSRRFGTPGLVMGSPRFDTPAPLRLVAPTEEARKRKSSIFDSPPTPLGQLQMQAKRPKPLSLLSAGDSSLPLFVPESALHFGGHSVVRIVRNRRTGLGEIVPWGAVIVEDEDEDEVGVEQGVRMDVDMDVAEEVGRRSRSPVLMLDVEEDIAPPVAIAEDRLEEEVVVVDKALALNSDAEELSAQEIVSEGSPVLKPTNSRKQRGLRIRHYLPMKGLTVDEIVYGKIQAGEDIPSEDEDREFCIVSTYKPPGQRKYVSRQIQYLLHCPPTLTTIHKGHLRTAIKPYRDHLVLKHHHQSITLFTALPNNTCKASKSTTATTPLLWPLAPTSHPTSDLQLIHFPNAAGHPQPKINTTDNSNHDWDYLAKWQNMEDDHELPLFGDSGSEGEYSVDHWEEMEAERGPQERPLGLSRRVPLEKEEVMKNLVEGVNLIVENWREKVLPRKEATAWRLYRAAKKRRERKKTARDARVRIEELEERLEKMKEQVCGVVWMHKGDVRKQVKILGPTVQDWEEQRWLAGLMERTKTPERPERVRIGAKAVGAVEDEGEDMGEEGDDEESLGSTSEDDYDSDEDEGMDGFIVADAVRDVVDGVEVAVEGEKEVEEELARKAAENELLDSDDDEDEAPKLPIRRQKPSAAAEKAAEPDQEDHSMTGMDDAADEPASATEDEVIIVPRLDKGKGKASPTPPIRVVKQEPTLLVHNPRPVIRSLTSNKDIPIIDLTMDDSPPKANGKKDRRKLGRITAINVSDSDVEEGEVEEEESNKKLSREILERLVRETEQQMRMAILYRLDEVKIADLFSTATMFSRQLHMKKIKNVPGLDDFNAEIYRPITEYYVSWVLGKIVKNSVLTMDQLSLIEDMRKFNDFLNVLLEILRPFNEGLSELGLNGASPSVLKYDKGKAIRLRTSEMNPASTSTGHRKKPRKEVIEDAEAKAKRADLDRTMRNIQRRAKEEEKRTKTTGATGATDGVRINIGKYSKHSDIYFHPDLAAALKPHQIEGIRFMWAQLVQTGENRGALLAHTMGLGKTLQVIALLYTMATAASSKEKMMYEQIPEHLRVSKTLVLSPPGLVENWWDEFHKWLPINPKSGRLDLGNIGEIIRADGTVAVPERQRNIQRWYENGGVLLMGYQTFRLFVLKGEEEDAGPRDRRLRDMLLKGPNIIIADEAHQLKNPVSKISEATRGFRSMSRIAMTGSPLSNNLMEYWAMIDWIDPHFLGDRREFDDKYVQPINDGLYAESSIPERRKCLKMLTVLKNDIGPKVHRMDISVIQHDLPQKTEFLIKVPLTEFQVEMYKKFLKDPTTTGEMGNINTREVSGTKFFDFIYLLSLICSHPLCFVEALEMREKANQDSRARPPPPRKPSGIIDLDDELEDLEDPDASGTKLMDDLLKDTNKPYPWARELMDTVSEPSAVKHSYKMMLVKSIIECTIRAGDKLLLFAHNTLALSLLERHLGEWGYDHQKLDGRTQMSTRQTITKKFNAGEGGNVCLISTEAGGLGLNLPGANRIIIFDFKWSPMWEEQAVGRAFRLGQKKHVYVYRFHACGTYEEIMRNKVLFKTQLHSRVVDKRDPIRHATKNVKQYFAEPYDVPSEDLKVFKGKDPLVLDKIIGQVDFIRSIENTETFQRDDENDRLTEEELRETEQMLKDQRDGRKAQGQQLTDEARKADGDYRKKLAENADKQAELQLSQEVAASNPLAAGSVKHPAPGTQASTRMTPRTAAPPASNSPSRAVDPGSILAGHLMMTPRAPPRPTPKDLGPPQPSSVPPTSRPRPPAPAPNRTATPRPKPAAESPKRPPTGRPGLPPKPTPRDQAPPPSNALPKAKPGPKYGRQPVPPPPPPPAPPVKNKFGLTIDQLPGLNNILKAKGKVPGKGAEDPAAAGTLRLQGQ